MNRTDEMDITGNTNSIVRRMFFNTADQNYISARAAFFGERDWDFWWLMLHALEKYLKVILLMNGRSAKGVGHDLFELLCRVAQIDQRLVPPDFIRPRVIGLGRLHEYSNSKFLGRLNDYGSAGNRYGTYGYTLFLADLFHADQLIYWARRYARPLKVQVSDKEEHDWIEVLSSQQCNWRQHGGPLEEIACLNIGSSRRRPLDRLNTAFFPDQKHILRAWRSSASNSALAEYCEDLTQSLPGSENHILAHSVIGWALDNIQFNDQNRKELRSLLKLHPIPNATPPVSTQNPPSNA